MQKQRTTFQGGDLRIEGILHIPDGEGPFPAVVVCHPHPLYGGSMDNNVVDAICEALADAAILAFKFNFRGVGRSQGRYDEGRGEGEDSSNAITYVATLKEVNPTRLGLCGYSAGATFSLPACYNDERIEAIAAISPPLGMFDFSFLRKCSKPTFLVSGGHDDFTPRKSFDDFCRELPDTCRRQVFPEADHFWCGHEPYLSKRITAFFTDEL